MTPIGKVADDRVSLSSIRLWHRQPRCNVALIGREPTDWRVSVLQVAGSVDWAGERIAMEVAGKVKLQAREFGLCRN